jgi:hypothetical protein
MNPSPKRLDSRRTHTCTHAHTHVCVCKRAPYVLPAASMIYVRLWFSPPITHSFHISTRHQFSSLKADFLRTHTMSSITSATFYRCRILHILHANKENAQIFRIILDATRRPCVLLTDTASAVFLY